MHSATKHIIAVHVEDGNNRRTWYLNKYGLCHHSVFFRHVYECGYYDIEFLLENTDPALFELSVRFMSTGDYGIEVSSDDASDDDSPVEVKPSPPLTQREHTQAWLLGQKLASIRFMNCAMTKLASFFNSPSPSDIVICPDAVLCAFGATTGSSKLKWFFEDATAYAVQQGVRLNMAENATWKQVLLSHPEFMDAVLERMASGRAEESPADFPEESPADYPENYQADFGDLDEEYASTLR